MLCYNVGMGVTIVKQFKVADQEMGVFNVADRKIGRYAWRLHCLRRKESDEAIAVIKQAIAEAEDPERVPVKINWKDTVGLIEIDDTSSDRSYIIEFEDTNARRFSSKSYLAKVKR